MEAQAQSPRAVHCARCRLRPLCLAARCDDAEAAALAGQVRWRRVARGDRLFEPGQEAAAIYAVRQGCLMVRLPRRPTQRAPVLGFAAPGDVIGLDAIGDRRHTSEAIAVDDSVVCMLGLDALDALCAEVPGVRSRLLELLAAELRATRTLALSLRGQDARARVAAFLHGAFARQERRGNRAPLVTLPMRRDHIGAHLGLAFETVSRCLHQLQDEGIVQVAQRRIRVCDRGRLDAVARQMD